MKKCFEFDITNTVHSLKMSLINLCYILLLYLCYVESLNENCANLDNNVTDVNCSKQLWQDHQNGGGCEVKYYPSNTEECFNWTFNDSVDALVDLGNVQIKPFVWTYQGQRQYTIFNVTFTDIRWNNLKFRFQARDNKTEPKNHCRSISIHSDEPLNITSALNYDCYWSEQAPRYQNVTYFFEYEAKDNFGGVARGQYFFIVPPLKMLQNTNNNWIPFVYLNFLKPEYFDIHIVIPDNVDFDYYKIEICNSDLPKPCSELAWIRTREQEAVHSNYHMFEPGLYTFRITPKDENCLEEPCKGEPFGPPIKKIPLDEKDRIVYSILWIGLIFVIFWIPIVLWMIYRGPDKKIRPTVFIVHPPGNALDNRVVDCLSQYFKLELNWKVLGKKSIRETEHNDPYMLCLQACKRADIILYVVNPFSITQTPEIYVGDDIYRNFHKIFLEKVRNDQIGCPIVNVVFDRHNAWEVPEELSLMKTFKLFKDWNRLLQFIMHYSWWDTIKHPVPTLGTSLIGKELYAIITGSTSMSSKINLSV